jgi:prepilin-type processing-associated H-X9-DG protein
MMLMDSVTKWVDTVTVNPGFGTYEGALRHGGRANILYADGHAGKGPERDNVPTTYATDRGNVFWMGGAEPK